MLFRKCLVSFLVFLILICTVPAFAEEPGTLLSDADLQYQEQLFEQTRPILEMTVAASMLSDVQPVEFDAGDEISSHFASACQALSSLYGIQLPADIDTWLNDNYLLSFSKKQADHPIQTDQYIGLFMLDLTPSPEGDQFALTAQVYIAPKPFDELSDEDWENLIWADTMAVMTLRSDTAAQTGWKVASLHYLSAYFSDDTEESDLPPIQVFQSYYNEKYACSVSYPAIFPEELIKSSDDGMACTLQDGSASVEIHIARLDQASSEQALQNVLNSHPDVTILSTEMDNMTCVEFSEQSMITRWFCVQTSRELVTVSMSWNPDIHPEFSDLADNMMDSLISEEDSLG